MSETISMESSPSNPWLIAEVLFPPIRVRFALALLLTFFPCGILYPLEWPVRELVTLCSWVWVFPSAVGCLSLALVPLLPNGTYGYFAFNLLCFSATLGVAHSAIRSRSFDKQAIVDLHRLARFCILLTFGIGLLQVITSPEAWASVFKDMSLGEGGRGAGLRLEPSLLAAPLALYLSLLVWRIQILESNSRGRKRRGPLLVEGALVVLLTLLLTRSLSVLALAMCFAPAFGLRLRNVLTPILAVLGGLLAGFLVFADRITQALQDSSGSAAALITVGVSSWRNVPDLLMIFNYRDFLLPGDPAEIRNRINTFATLLNPTFSWVENTYSTFSAGGSTVGLLATGCLFVGGILVEIRRLSSSIRPAWLMLYVANWFVTPKFEAAGWVALALLALAHRVNETEPNRGGNNLIRLIKANVVGSAHSSAEPAAAVSISSTPVQTSVMRTIARKDLIR